MELKVIFSFMAMFAWGMIIYFIIATVFSQRRQEKDIADIKHELFRVSALVHAFAVRQNFNQVNEMKDMLRNLVESEQYEEAEKLRVAIEKAEQAAVKSLRTFKERFKDVVSDVQI